MQDTGVPEVACDALSVAKAKIHSATFAKAALSRPGAISHILLELISRLESLTMQNKYRQKDVDVWVT